MSTKKDNFQLSDKKLMKLAISLAENQKYFTGTNPSVGCVITRNNKIISYGVTGKNGRPHAEINAINKNKSKDLYNSSMYVSLEPCTHYGKTPPCTNTLIKKKFKKVFFSHTDEDKRTKNTAKNILEKHKINVKNNFINNKTKKLYFEYDFIRKNNFPYVIGKLAISQNNRIYRDKTPVSNLYSKDITHILRYRCQALLTSYVTINNDNPKLTCRLNGLEKCSPTIVIIDKDLKVKSSSKIFKNKDLKKIIFSKSNNKDKIKKLRHTNTEIFNIRTLSKEFDLKYVLSILHKKNLHQILIECGPTLLENFINNGLVNEFYLFKSNKSIKIKDTIYVKKLLKILNTNYKKNKINTFIDKDKLTCFN